MLGLATSELVLGLATSVLCVLYLIVRGTGVGPGYICVKCVLYLIMRGTGVGPGYICVKCVLYLIVRGTGVGPGYICVMCSLSQFVIHCSMDRKPMDGMPKIY